MDDSHLQPKMRPGIRVSHSVPARRIKSEDFRDRAFLVVGVLAFEVVFHVAYVRWLFPVFGYTGFNYIPLRGIYVIAPFVFGVIPALWMPIRFTRPSQFFYWTLYLVVYLPSDFALMYAGLSSSSRACAVIGALFLGLAVMGLPYLLPLIPLRRRPISGALFWRLIALATIGMTLWVLVFFHGRMRLVTFDQVYSELRFDSADLTEGSNIGYAVMWLATVINPLFMAWGLCHKRLPQKVLLFMAGAGGQVLLYSTAGLKSDVLSVVVLLAVYCALRRHLAIAGLIFTWMAALCITVTLLGTYFFNSPLAFLIAALVLARTFGIPGLTTALYDNFFADHPTTLYSHVHGISSLIRYPYTDSIGQEVGYYFFGDPRNNANANLWAVDGLAAFGIRGIVLVSVLCAIVFWILDSVTPRRQILFAVLLISYASINLANVSLFTTLITGGLLFQIVILYILPAPSAATRIDTC
jgi:hypothetical protein